MIHRAILGSIERCVAILTESFGGKWPFWLSPRQVKVVPIGKSQMQFAQSIATKLFDAGIEAEADADCVGQFLYSYIFICIFPFHLFSVYFPTFLLSLFSPRTMIFAFQQNFRHVQLPNPTSAVGAVELHSRRWRQRARSRHLRRANSRRSATRRSRC